MIAIGFDFKEMGRQQVLSIYSVHQTSGVHYQDFVDMKIKPWIP
jgi:hypothetical protein